MNAYPEKQQYTADDLAAIIAILRDPENGCPWDKVQTHTSIRMNFLEEAYEAVDAIAQLVRESECPGVRVDMELNPASFM